MTHGHLGRSTESKWTGAALFDLTGRYRYRLERELNGLGGSCLFVMLNPSSATSDRNDPTITRCCVYAERWGYSRLLVGNIFAYRATSPHELPGVDDPVGPENDHHLVAMAQSASKVVCAWGNHGEVVGRGHAVFQLLLEAGVDPYVLQFTKAGQPSHPLYLPGSLEPQPWRQWFGKTWHGGRDM